MRNVFSGILAWMVMVIIFLALAFVLKTLWLAVF